VQGVGFRYTARHAAEMLGLTGYVKNEYDDSVTVELQGKEEEIDMFFQMMSQDRYIVIDRMEKEKLPLDENEGSFRIKY
jgi:acylphosphatase